MRLEIWKKYATNHLEPAIGSAVATRILRREESPEELLRHVAGLIELYEADDPSRSRFERPMDSDQNRD